MINKISYHSSHYTLKNSFKGFFALAMALLVSFAIAFSVAAQSNVETAQDDPEGALIFVEKLSNEAIQVLDDITITQFERDNAFKELLREGFDLEYIGKLTLGRHWRSANAEQKQEFQLIFPEYVLSIYYNRLSERGDETFEVINTVPAGKKDIYVRSEIIRTDGPPLAADWRVRYKNGAFKIVDLKIEGISMVLTQRDEFSSIINQHEFDGLLAEINDKIEIKDMATTTSDATDVAMPGAVVSN